MTPRTLGLTDPLHQYLMQVGFREHEELKRVREETAQLPGVHMLLAPEQALPAMEDQVMVWLPI